MKNRVKSAFFMIILATLVLSACSKNNNNAGSPESSSNTPSVTPSGSAPAAPSDGKFDPPITLTTVGTVSPTVQYASGDSVDNNPWTREYEKRFGIKLKTLWTVDASQWETKTNLMIGTGDIPDFFMASPAQFKQLVDADLLADLTSAFENAPDRAAKILTEGGEAALDSARFGGKLMAIPFTGAPKEGSQMVWIRTDWLQNLGLPEPKTMDDLLQIIDAFTTQDPDGNNKNDTFGLAVDKDFTVLKGFFNGYHAYYDIWIKDAEGKLQYSNIQPEMKTALQKLQELFKKKQIDPEFGTKDFAKVAETIVSGKIGVMFNSPYAGLYPLQSNIDQDPKADWKAFPIVSADSQPAKNQTALGVVGYWVVKKEVEHPEALFSMLDLWVELFYENKDDAINKQFINDGNTEIWQMNKISAYRAFKNADQRIKVMHAMDTKDTSELTGDDKGVYDKILAFQAGDRTLWGWNAIFGADGSMGVTDQYRQNNAYVSDEFIAAPLPAMTERGADIGKFMNERFTKIIYGASSIDEFDKFVSDWKQRGGDAITAEINEWYANR